MRLFLSVFGRGADWGFGRTGGFDFPKCAGALAESAAASQAATLMMMQEQGGRKTWNIGSRN